VIEQKPKETSYQDLRQMSDRELDELNDPIYDEIEAWNELFDG
jgi:hypothetical protein